MHAVTGAKKKKAFEGPELIMSGVEDDFVDRPWNPLRSDVDQGTQSKDLEDAVRE